MRWQSHFMLQIECSDFGKQKPVLYEIFQVAVLAICLQAFPSSPPCSCSRTVLPLLCFRLLLTTAWETTQSHSSPALDSKTLHPETALEMFPALACFRLSNILLCYCLPCFYKLLPFLRSRIVDLLKPLFPPFFPRVSSQSANRALFQVPL